MYPKLRHLPRFSLVNGIYGVCVEFMLFVPSTTNLSYFNQWLTCLLYLRNGLLSVMMQQNCNNALPLVGEELPHMKCNLCKIS